LAAAVLILRDHTRLIVIDGYGLKVVVTLADIIIHKHLKLFERLPTTDKTYGMI